MRLGPRALLPFWAFMLSTALGETTVLRAFLARVQVLATMLGWLSAKILWALSGKRTLRSSGFLAALRISPSQSWMVLERTGLMGTTSRGSSGLRTISPVPPPTEASQATSQY